MRQFRAAASVVALLAVLGLGLAGTAAASTAGTRSVADTVATLQAEGYHVQINGSSNVPLSLCKVTGIQGLNNSNVDAAGRRIDKELFTTIYVDVTCDDG